MYVYITYVKERVSFLSVISSLKVFLEDLLYALVARSDLLDVLCDGCKWDKNIWF